MAQTDSRKTTTDPKGNGTTTGTQGRGPTNEMRRTANPTHEEIARRAYELFLARGGQHGRHEEDWYQAQRELQSRRQ